LNYLSAADGEVSTYLDPGAPKCDRAIGNEATMEIRIESASPRLLAAVRRTVALGGVASAWRPALDQVWQFLRSQPGLRTDGHNVFLCYHPARRDLPMAVDFGVEVTRRFERSGEVHTTETPGGGVATAVHIGPYDRLSDTHSAIHDWAKRNHRSFAGKSWEIFGDWDDDPTKLETTVVYLLD
jgi:effector-binding domain-containing protein